MRQLIKRINDYLEQFGHTAKGEPIFRCVFSNNQLENRFGTYNEFHNSIFLRTVTKVKLVPKYPRNKDCYVIERLFPPEMCNHEELPDSKQNGSYEPIYFFQTEDGKVLEPNLQFVAILMHSVMHPLSSSEIKSHYEQLQLKRELADEQAVNDLFDEESILADKIKFGEAVSFSGMRKIKK